MKDFLTFINERISRSELKIIEDQLDMLFKSIGIDIEFTRHFHDRVNDPRNKKQITTDEILTTYQKLFNKHKPKISGFKPDFEAVIKDFNSNINIPFVINVDRNSNELDLVAKTVMRKKNFKTRNKVYHV